MKVKTSEQKMALKILELIINKIVKIDVYILHFIFVCNVIFELL